MEIPTLANVLISLRKQIDAVMNHSAIAETPSEFQEMLEDLQFELDLVIKESQ